MYRTVYIEEIPLSDGRIQRTLIDPETGEVIQTGKVGFRGDGQKPKKLEHPPFARVWMPNLLKLVKDKNLKQGERALLFDLLIFLDWQSTMLVHPEKGSAVNTREIADYLGYSLGYVSETLSALHDKGIIAKVSAGKGRPFKYHFNCNIAFYGKNMNDIREYEIFNRDCSFIPEIVIDYGQEDKSIRKIRRDLILGVTPVNSKKEK